MIAKIVTAQLYANAADAYFGWKAAVAAVGVSIVASQPAAPTANVSIAVIGLLRTISRQRSLS